MNLRRRHAPRTFHVRIEALETRTVLSAAAAAATTITPELGPAVSSPSPGSAVSPQTLLSDYDFSASATAGQGTTIAIVDAYGNPTLASDLKAFDAYYGLPAASLTMVNENGQTTGLPAANAGWDMEEALDVEWAHVAAPGAKIVLVEASSASLSDLLAATQTAAKLGNVVSMSWEGSEFRGETAYDTTAYFANPNVTFVAASGDDGGASGVEWPSASPYVLSVGGTTLNANGSETAWNASGSWWTGYGGSAGGVSRYEPPPSYQATALGANAAYGRLVPDVASDANPSSGVAVYTTAPGNGATGWFTIGGTSAGAPVWAGLIADADQARFAVGKPALSSSQTLAGLYSLYGTPSYPSSAYATAFHDVTSGYNFAGNAGPGYDLVTGLGSPIASNIIARAALYDAAPAPATTTTVHHASTRSFPSWWDFVAGQAGPATPAASVTTVSQATVANAWISTLPAAVATAPAQTAVHVAATPVALTVATDAAAPNQSIATPTTRTAPAIEAPSVPTTIDIDAPAAAEPAAPESIAPALDRTPDVAPPVAPAVDDVAVWDEAMAQVRLSRPAPIAPVGAAGEEEAATAPRLAVAFAAAVAWREARRRADARRIVAAIPRRG